MNLWNKNIIIFRWVIRGWEQLCFLSSSKQMPLYIKYSFLPLIPSIKDLGFICNSNQTKAEISLWIIPPTVCPYSSLSPAAAVIPAVPENIFCLSYRVSGAEVWLLRRRSRTWEGSRCRRPPPDIRRHSKSQALHENNISGCSGLSGLAEALYSSGGGWQEPDCKS